MTPRRQPEKKIESAIVKAVEALGGRVDEFSQRRRGRCVKCGWRIPAGSQQTPGIPDLRVVWEDHNLRLWVEVKAGSNTLSAF